MTPNLPSLELLFSSPSMQYVRSSAIKLMGELSALSTIVPSIFTTRPESRDLDSPYESKQVVKKFQDLYRARVTVDRIAIRHVPNHKTSSLCFFQWSGPACTFYNSQNGVHTKTYLYRKKQIRWILLSEGENEQKIELFSLGVHNNPPPSMEITFD